nr:MAG TPA: hypothetical protein [Caudoviricetes sp.]
MNHRHFKLNQVKARIEGRKALYKQFRAVSKEELKEKYDIDWPPKGVVVVDEDNLTVDALKERSTIVLSKEEAEAVEANFGKPNELMDEVIAKVEAGDFPEGENP